MELDIRIVYLVVRQVWRVCSRMMAELRANNILCCDVEWNLDISALSICETNAVVVWFVQF